MAQKVILLVLLPFFCWGQSPATLRKVVFASANNNAWVQIKKDPPDDNAYLSDLTSTIAWEQGVADPLPVAYISGGRASITPCFVLVGGLGPACATAGTTVVPPKVYIKATWGGGTIAGERELVPDGSGLWRPIVPFYVDFAPDIVRAYTPFSVEWKATCNPQDGNSWKDAGTSTNPLYVLRGQKIGNAEYYYTSIHVACTGANGKGGGVNGERDVVDGVFSGFQGLNVETVAHEPLYFWKNNTSPGNMVKDLLRTFNGPCGAWARFFQDLLEIHGINSTRTLIQYKENQKVPTQFITTFKQKLQQAFGNPPNFIVSNIDSPNGKIMVKNWTVSMNNFYAVEATADFTNGSVLFNATLNGISAQGYGNTDPLSWFGNHVVVEYNTRYYDPSYGKVFDGKDSWEQNSLDGLGAEVFYQDINVFPFKEAKIIWLSEQPVPNVIQTDFKIDP